MNVHVDSAHRGTLLDQFERIAETGSWFVDDVPAEWLARSFLQHNWERCRDGLLRKTSLLRVEPEPSAAPRMFYFEIDSPYKRKVNSSAAVELVAGPVSGMIYYRADLFANPASPYIAVQIDPSLSYFHPNCCRQRGSLLCLGDIPHEAFPFPLDMLLESHLYPIVTHQNQTPSQAFDEEAAMYFALDPDAMHGLEPVRPLY